MEEENSSHEDTYNVRTEELTTFLKEELSEDSFENMDFEYVVFNHINQQMMKRSTIISPFGKDFEWVNTTRPISSVEDLDKKIYVMDFFTYCCINCLHVIPILTEVEEKYKDRPEFAVISIHCPKFPNEKDILLVKQAVEKYKVKHPVLNDPDCILWRKFGVMCWPTVFIVGPDNVLLFVLIGEVEIAKLPQLCKYIFKYFEKNPVQLDLSPLPICVVNEPKKNKYGFLFPANISTNGAYVILSDTGNNRLILMSRDLEVKEIIGSGIVGEDDGPFSAASFNSPRGTAWYRDDHKAWHVYVADTANHSIRKLNMNEKMVSTVFSDKIAASGDDFLYQKFHSPWNVCIGPQPDDALALWNTVYIAVAGSHQIWQLNIKDEFKASNHRICIPFAGTGKEENRQHSDKAKAGFAQPSGICYSELIPEKLFVADSESSTIKSVCISSRTSNLSPPVKVFYTVKNIVGGGLDPKALFQFGDEDGQYLEAKLQHPLGVCVLNKSILLIADTYNHKIKFIHLLDNHVETINEIQGLNEPGDLCIMDNILLIADTNNHRIVKMPLNHLQLPTNVPAAFQNIPDAFDFILCSDNLAVKDEPEILLTISDAGEIYCYFTIISNEKYELNEGPQTMSVSFQGTNLHFERTKYIFGNPQPALILKPVPSCDKTARHSKTSQVKVRVSIPVCELDRKICCQKNVLFKFFVKYKDTGPSTIRLNLKLSDEHKLF